MANSEDDDSNDELIEIFHAKIIDIISAGRVEYGRILYLLATDLARAEVELWESITWDTLFSAGIPGYKGIVESICIPFFNSVGNSFGDFFQRLTSVPLRVISTSGILAAFPIPKWSQQRVMVTADAYRMVAAEVVEVGLDLISEANWPSPVQKAASTGMYWDDVYSALKGRGSVYIGKVVKSVFKGKLRILAKTAATIFGSIAVLVFLWFWAKRVNAKERESAMKFRSLTNKNPFVKRVQKHRVRDNPKLPNR